MEEGGGRGRRRVGLGAEWKLRNASRREVK